MAYHISQLHSPVPHLTPPAQLSWLCLVYPSLTLAYLGQIAYIIHDPSAASSIFWSSIPKPVYWPMVVIATLAAALASQAMISGCFSIVQQAVSLNCFPRVTIRHTSHGHKGQVRWRGQGFEIIAL